MVVHELLHTGQNLITDGIKINLCLDQNGGHLVILPRQKLKLPIRFHDLRHTFATHAIASGVDAKTLSGILGHTNASFTLDTYTHVTPDMQKAASGIVGGFMEDLLGKGLRPWQSDGKAEPAR